MVASYYAGTIPTAEGIEQLDEEMLSLFGYSTNSDNGTDAGDNGTEPTGYDLATLAIDYFHVSDSHRYANRTIPQLQQELANGYPVIIAVFTHMSPADGYHKQFMVLVGMDDNFVYVNDPGRTWQQTHAGPLAYTIGAFQTAWKENTSNAVVVIHPNAPIPPLSPTWSHFTPSGTGPNLNGNPPVYDPGSNRLIVYGGLLADNSCCTSDTWVLSNANGLGGMPQWQQLSGRHASATRGGHSAVYDATSNRMIIFGGGQLGGCGVYCVLFNDVWVLSNANGVAGPPTWTQLIPSAPNGYPAPRAAQLAVYDPATNRMTIFGGGNNGTGDRNDTWVLTNANGFGGTPEWVPLSPAGNLPVPREIAVGSYDPIANSMTLFGGVPGFLEVGIASLSTLAAIWWRSSNICRRACST